MLSNALDKKAASALMERFLEDARLFVVGVNNDGSIFYTNAHFLEATGYSDLDVRGKSWFENFVPLSKIDTVIKKMKAIIDNNYSMISENPIVKRDGTQLSVAWHNCPVVQEGVVTGVLSVGVDVTARDEVELLLKLNEKTMRERAETYAQQNRILEETKKSMLNLLEESKQLEIELQNEKRNVEQKVVERTSELMEEKARLLASINAFPSGFILTDINKTILITNSKLNEIFGVTRKEWFLDDINDFLSESTNFYANFERCLRDKTPILLKEIDYGRKFLEIYLSPIFLSPISNDIIGGIVLIRDITEQKIIERSKEEFFSIASHELRTPLTAIRGNVDLIRKHFSSRLNDNNFNEMIDDIHSSSDRLIALVNEFLNMSKLEQGKLHFERENFNICSVIDNVILELTTNAAAKNLELKFLDTGAGDPSVVGDHNRTKEILINLISNAITYTEHGSVTVSIEQSDHHLNIKVTDSGKGISLQNQNLLFRKFQQANVTLYTRDASQSTGLGLYISKLMCEAMGGVIYLEKSEVGVGSTFVFTLPLA